MPSPLDTATRGGAWPRGRRLLRRAEFQATYERGLRRSSAHFTVFGLRRTDDGPLRCGITASRKLGDAVTRNRIRRRTRELLRGQKPPAQGHGCDLVVNPRPTVAQADFANLAQELAQVTDKLCRALAAAPPEAGQ